jgi:alcohol dehydrogenase
MGASAFQKGLGAVHALSHPVGAFYDTHHGMTNAVVLPYVLAFNRPAIEPRISRLAAYLGLQPTFGAFLAWVLELRRELGVPHTLRDFGIGDDKIEVMSAMAPKDPTAAGNPVPINTMVCRRLYRNAFAGELGL